MGAVSGTNVGITAVARWHKVGSLCDVHRQQPLTIYQAQVLGVGRSSAGLQSRHGTARRRRMRYNNGIVVGPMEVCHTPREHKASSPTSDRAFDSARIASTILLSCALLGALRFPLQSGRLASLSAQGAVSVAHAGNLQCLCLLVIIDLRRNSIVRGHPWMPAISELHQRVCILSCKS